MTYLAIYAQGAPRLMLSCCAAPAVLLCVCCCPVVCVALLPLPSDNEQNPTSTVNGVGSTCGVCGHNHTIRSVQLNTYPGIMWYTIPVLTVVRFYQLIWHGEFANHLYVLMCGCSCHGMNERVSDRVNEHWVSEVRTSDRRTKEKGMIERMPCIEQQLPCLIEFQQYIVERSVTLLFVKFRQFTAKSFCFSQKIGA